MFHRRQTNTPVSSDLVTKFITEFTANYIEVLYIVTYELHRLRLYSVQQIFAGKIDAIRNFSCWISPRVQAGLGLGMENTFPKTLEVRDRILVK